MSGGFVHKGNGTHFVCCDFDYFNNTFCLKRRKNRCKQSVTGAAVRRGGDPAQGGGVADGGRCRKGCNKHGFQFNSTLLVLRCSLSSSLPFWLRCSKSHIQTGGELDFAFGKIYK